MRWKHETIKGNVARTWLPLEMEERKLRQFQIFKSQENFTYDTKIIRHPN